MWIKLGFGTHLLLDYKKKSSIISLGANRRDLLTNSEGVHD